MNKFTALLCPCRQCTASGYTLESFIAGQAARFAANPNAEHREIWRKWKLKKPAEYMQELARLIEEAKILLGEDYK